jgi:hypothetical protein
VVDSTIPPASFRRFAAVARWVWLLAALLGLVRQVVFYFIHKDVGVAVLSASECRSKTLLPSLSLGGVCTRTCSHDSDCTRDTACQRGNCVPHARLSVGEMCAGWWECLSGACLPPDAPSRQGVCTAACGADRECSATTVCGAGGHCLPKPTKDTGDPCSAVWECKEGECITDVELLAADRTNGEPRQPAQYCSRTCPTGKPCPAGFGCRLAAGTRLCVRGQPDAPEIEVLDRAQVAPSVATVRDLMNLIEKTAPRSPERERSARPGE